MAGAIWASSTTRMSIAVAASITAMRCCNCAAPKMRLLQMSEGLSHGWWTKDASHRLDRFAAASTYPPLRRMNHAIVVAFWGAEAGLNSYRGWAPRCPRAAIALPNPSRTPRSFRCSGRAVRTRARAGRAVDR